MKLTKPFESIKSFFSREKTRVSDKIKEQSMELAKMERDLKNSTWDADLYRDWWSTRKMIRFWLIGLMIAALWYFSYNVLNWIFLIISAYIVSIIVETLISFFEKKKIKRSISILLAYFIFIVILIGIFVLVIPFLVNQLADLISLWLTHVSHLQSLVSEKWLDVIIADSWLPVYFKEYIIEYIWNNDFMAEIQASLQTNLSGIISLWSTYASYVWWWFVSFLSSFSTFFMHFFLFITLCVLFSADKKNVVWFLAWLWWKSKEKIYRFKIEKMYKNLAVWLKSRLLLSLFVALAVYITLLIMWWCGLEIPHKLWISIITWLLDFVPYIWPILTWVLIFIVAILYNPLWVALLLLILLWVFNFVQENVLTPVVMKRSLWISPVLILISMMLWWVIMWFMWILLSVPIAAILVIFFENRNWDVFVENNPSKIVDNIKSDVKDEVVGVKKSIKNMLKK